VSTRALVVGLGAIGQRHARNLRDLLGDDLVLSALRSGGGGAKVTDQLTVAEGSPDDDCDGGVFYDLDRALEARPDIVVVASPTSTHVDMARAAVEAGADVFIEKPLSDSEKGVHELLEAAERRAAVVAVGCQLRFSPALRRLEELLAANELGSLVTVQVEQGEYLPAWHPYEDYRQSYAARRELGGGVTLTQIHELDYVRWLFGAPRRLFAVGGRFGSLDIDVEDTVSVLLECETYGRPLPVHVHLDYLQQSPRRGCRVVGEAGVVDLDLRAPSLTRRSASGQVLEQENFAGHTRAQLFRDELADFLRCCRERSAPAVGLEDAADTNRLALAILRSMSERTLVEV
jgi:predicted dehydrogenase